MACWRAPRSERHGAQRAKPARSTSRTPRAPPTAPRSFPFPGATQKLGRGPKSNLKLKEQKLKLAWKLKFHPKPTAELKVELKLKLKLKVSSTLEPKSEFKCESGNDFELEVHDEVGVHAHVVVEGEYGMG